MKTASFAGLALCLALQPWPFAPQNPGQRKIPVSERQKIEIDRLELEIQGLWRLDSLRVGHTTFQRDSAVGYLLAAPEYMSIEFHIENVKGQGNSDPVDYLFQTGIFEYRFSPLGELAALSRIGTNGIDSEEIDFEPPGSRRVYKVSITPTSLVLDRESSTLNFTRVSRPEHTIEQKKKNADEAGASEG
jgi:hypothetical protein